MWGSAQAMVVCFTVCAAVLSGQTNAVFFNQIALLKYFKSCAVKYSETNAL